MPIQHAQIFSPPERRSSLFPPEFDEPGPSSGPVQRPPVVVLENQRYVPSGACHPECRRIHSPGYDINRPCHHGTNIVEHWTPYSDGRFIYRNSKPSPFPKRHYQIE